MSRCEECGQEKPPTDEQLLALKVDAYRAAFGMLKELFNQEPPEFWVLRTARFLAGDRPEVADLVTLEDDDDE